MGSVWEVATWLLASRPGSPTMGRNKVATRNRCRDIELSPGGSRPSLGVAT